MDPVPPNCDGKPSQTGNPENVVPSESVVSSYIQMHVAGACTVNVAGDEAVAPETGIVSVAGVKPVTQFCRPCTTSLPIHARPIANNAANQKPLVASGIAASSQKRGARTQATKHRTAKLRLNG